MRNPQTARRCDCKRAYASEGAAIKAAWHITLKKREIVEPYKCIDCTAWHIGHAQGQRRLELEARLNAHPAATVQLGDKSANLTVVGFHPNNEILCRCECGAVVHRGVANFLKGKRLHCPLTK